MQSGPLSARRGGPDTHDRTKRPSGRCRHADEVLKNTSDSRAPTTPPRGGEGGNQAEACVFQHFIGVSAPT